MRAFDLQALGRIGAATKTFETTHPTFLCRRTTGNTVCDPLLDVILESKERKICSVASMFALVPKLCPQVESGFSSAIRCKNTQELIERIRDRKCGKTNMQGAFMCSVPI